MQEITVTEPAFVTTFQCSGTHCRDHCCKSWNIHLDKGTVKRYLSSKDESIRKIAKGNIIILKKDVATWGMIKLDEKTRTCPYLTEERLCHVQRTLGVQALSPTCKTFPRYETSYKNDVRKTLHLSCPEVSKSVLTDVNAMILKNKIIIQPTANTSPIFTQQQKLLNLFCMGLIDQANSDTDAGLYALIKFTLFTEKFDQIDNNALGKIELIYNTLSGQLQSGELKDELSTYSRDKTIKRALILILQNYFCNIEPGRSSGVLNYYIQCLLRVLTLENTHTIDEGIDGLESAWQRLCKTQNETGFDLKNLILYKLWNSNFPNQQNDGTLRALYMLCAEYYFIKMLIAASAYERTYLEKEDAINIVYSFHSLSQHNTVIPRDFHKHIETVRTGDDLSMIHLLT
ncbi:flagellin lysine-N-methylase [Citrobacter cronae]|uniref:flagellin lysine-N-methylase n=1 Tax=Citrobacter cronae TaxID=1748967 RepID=UPI001C121911|nr:flagellin lysine-N-methylase [Citrobacter cronae]MBU5385521.1 flagellin lysine-N-methylase [Citrobacter cronae]